MKASPARNLAEEYSNKSRDYSLLWSPVIRPMALPLLGELPLESARLILDCGTGTGALVPDLAAASPGSTIIGIDRAEGMLNLAPRLPGNSYGVMDAENLAFPSNLFDVATMIFVLFHLPEPVAAIREAIRTLRPGGTLGIVVWGKDMDVPGLNVWSEELDRLGAAPDPRPPELMRQNEMNDLAKVRSLLEESGAVRVRTFSQRFVHQWTVETLARLQVACGIAGRRAATMSREHRAQCTARVISRFKEMSPAQMRYNPEILFAVGEKTGGEKIQTPV